MAFGVLGFPLVVLAAIGNMALAAVPVIYTRPGMAPNRMPKETPVTLAISEPKLKAASIPAKTSDIVSSYGNMI